jgi:biotin synthase
MTLLADRSLSSDDITPDVALEILELPETEVPALVARAHEVRLQSAGPEVEVESIISAKTGGCPEDCAFCSQSRHWPTPVRPEPFIDIPPLVDAAKRAQEQGATEFCIVLAVRGPDDRIMQQVLAAVDALHKDTDMHVAASLGILTREQALQLREAGVRRYNHNLETARSHFSKIVSTHTWEERWETCQLVLELGMELCCGGIFGMGETKQQRVEFAFELKELGPREIPMNFLNPRPGTPLADKPLVKPLDAIKTIALFRLLFPEVVLRYAGGREVTLRELQSLGMLAGINGIIIGNYLTTLGRSPEDDLAMLSDLKMPLKSLGI